MLALTELTGAAGRMSPESQPLTRCGSPRLLRAQPRTRLLKILILGAARAPASAAASPGHCAEDPVRSPHGASVTPAHSLGAGLRSACHQPSRPVHLCRECVSVSRHCARCLITIQQRALESPVTALFGSYSLFAAHSISEKRRCSPSPQAATETGRGDPARCPASPLLLPVSGVN